MSIEGGKPNSEGFVRFEKRPNIQETIQRIKAIQPKVIFTVNFGEHGTFEDGLDATKNIDNCDVFIPEGAGWDTKTLELCNNISRGMNLSTDHLDPFYNGILRNLQGKEKTVKFIDYPKGHPDNKKFAMKFHQYYNPFFEPAERKEAGQQLALAIDNREAHMLAQLPKVLQEFIVENPIIVKTRQKNNEPINALLFLGSVHTRMYHALKEASPHSKRELFPNPHRYGMGGQLVRKFLFGKEISEFPEWHYY